MAGGGKDDELDEDDEDDDYDDYDDYDDDDTVPQKLVETNVTLDIKCRYGHFCVDQCFRFLYSSVCLTPLFCSSLLWSAVVFARACRFCTLTWKGVRMASLSNS